MACGSCTGKVDGYMKIESATVDFTTVVQLCVSAGGRDPP
jgi:hypothetical protein